MKWQSTMRLVLLASLLALVACQNPSPSLTEPASSPVPPVSSPLPAAPTPVEATPAPAGAAVASNPLAPDGAPGESYYAPFPVAITLDGNLDDWQGIPTVAMPPGSESTQGAPELTFAAAADDRFLYFAADVSDANIISGQHADQYWNEDSVEFYINATGNLELTAYQKGVVQITIPPLNMERAADDAIISGVQGTDAKAQVVVEPRDGGYVVEMAVPLQNDVWDISPEHGGVLGFQVHLNGASQADRDLKVIWSKRDTSDTSYQNPSVFGELIFYEVGQPTAARIAPEAPPTPVLIPIAADAVYKQAGAPIADRVEDLLAYMTLAEKIGQMTLVEKNSIVDADITNLFIGGLLSGGGGYPENNTPEGWADMVDGFQQYALDSHLGIPLIYGVDAVHGHNNVKGAVIFPHNIGLGAANDPALMERIGQVTAAEMAATGIYWNYAPAVSVPQDVRWGRTYEGYSEDPALVSSLAAAYLRGMQGEDLAADDTVIGTAKHYVGDGGTTWGTGSSGYQIDQGDTQVDEATLRAVHLPPYIAAIDAGARSIMISYSSWNGAKLHGHDYLINDLLKGELGFSGFVVSDWGGIDAVSSNYYDAVVTAINAGIDMNMVPYDYRRFIDALTKAVEAGDVPLERIDDAVRRILTVKFEMGLFEQPFANHDLLAEVGSEAHRQTARDAVDQSLVLLKNDDGILPLPKDVPALFVAGAAADDIGIQSGGWTIEWQGKEGAITPGTTILQGIQAAVGSSTEIEYSPSGDFSGNPAAEDAVCLAVVGEPPYAEGKGDSATLGLPAGESRVLRRLEQTCAKLVVVIVSGRPVMVTDYVDQWDGLVAAWLPGTEGQGVADVLFGDVPFRGKLPVTWPASTDQLPVGSSAEAPLFPFGFGLTP